MYSVNVVCPECRQETIVEPIMDIHVCPNCAAMFATALSKDLKMIYTYKCEVADGYLLETQD